MFELFKGYIVIRKKGFRGVFITGLLNNFELGTHEVNIFHTCTKRRWIITKPLRSTLYL